MFNRDAFPIRVEDRVRVKGTNVTGEVFRTVYSDEGSLCWVAYDIGNGAGYSPEELERLVSEEV